MKRTNRNVLCGLGAVAFGLFVVAPSARHYIPGLAALACPVSMAAMVFRATRLDGKTEPADSCDAGRSVADAARDLTTEQLLRLANLPLIRAWIAEIEHDRSEIARQKLAIRAASRNVRSIAEAGGTTPSNDL